jgi:protein-S-isoprenylcysteine O-methyltransferase Ste14
LDFVWSAVSIGLAIEILTDYSALNAEAFLYIDIHLLTAILFLIRRPPMIRLCIWPSYVVAGLSTVYVYAYDLSSALHSNFTAGKVLVPAGAVLTLLSLISLGKCFGVFPICRGLTTSGLYMITRHPLYASYIIMDMGLIISYPSQWNLCLALFGVTLFVWRIHYEEVLLQNLIEYRSYTTSVRFRLMPLVY